MLRGPDARVLAHAYKAHKHMETSFALQGFVGGRLGLNSGMSLAGFRYFGTTQGTYSKVFFHRPSALM